jgi:toxin ParE1/3/4
LDLDEIWEYIANDNINAAERWIGKLFDAFEAIARNPGIGHKRQDITDYPVFFWPLNAYLILYRVQGEQVEIVAVTQGARDIPSFLGRRPVKATMAPDIRVRVHSGSLPPCSAARYRLLCYGNHRLRDSYRYAFQG